MTFCRLIDISICCGRGAYTHTCTQKIQNSKTINYFEQRNTNLVYFCVFFIAFKLYFEPLITSRRISIKWSNVWEMEKLSTARKRRNFVVSFSCCVLSLLCKYSTAWSPTKDKHFVFKRTFLALLKRKVFLRSVSNRRYVYVNKLAAKIWKKQLLIPGASCSKLDI